MSGWRPRSAPADAAPAPTRRARRLTGIGGSLLGVILLVEGCTQTSGPAPAVPQPTVSVPASGTPTASPDPVVSSSVFPPMTGIQFDQSLRDGQRAGRSSLPRLGRLLAATEPGANGTIVVDPSGFHGRLLAVFTCNGSGGGVEVRVTRADRSLLGVRSAGCDPTNLNSAQSQPIGTVATGQDDRLTVTVTAAPSVVSYSVVLEEVATQNSPT